MDENKILELLKKTHDANAELRDAIGRLKENVNIVQGDMKSAFDILSTHSDMIDQIQLSLKVIDKKIRFMRREWVAAGLFTFLNRLVWPVFGLVVAYMLMLLGMHLSETRRVVSGNERKDVNSLQSAERVKQPSANNLLGTSSSIQGSPSNRAEVQLATQVTLQAAVENLYLNDSGKSKVPVDSIVSLVGKFLDLGLIPKEAADGLIGELKKHAVPIAFDLVKDLMRKYLGLGSDGEAKSIANAQSTPFATQLICNSFNSAPPKPVVNRPKPPHHKHESLCKNEASRGIDKSGDSESHRRIDMPREMSIH